MTQTPQSDDSDAVVRASLSALSQEYPQLPDSVADRLDRVLAELPPLSAPESTSRPEIPPIRTRWWHRRWNLAAAAMASVVAVFGALVLVAQPWSGSGAPTSAQDNAEADPRQETAAGPQEEAPGSTGEDSEGDTFNENEVDPAYDLTFSGHDYSPGEDMNFAETATSTMTQEELDPALKPVAQDPGQLKNCVGSVEISFQGTATDVDFGSFEGDPAIVVVVDTGADTGKIAAQRPGCGENGLDLLHSQDR